LRALLQYSSNHSKHISYSSLTLIDLTSIWISSSNLFYYYYFYLYLLSLYLTINSILYFIIYIFIIIPFYDRYLNKHSLRIIGRESLKFYVE
jgi:hypothetical protein